MLVCLESAKILGRSVAETGCGIANIALRIMTQRDAQIARCIKPRSQIAPRNSPQRSVRAPPLASLTLAAVSLARRSGRGIASQRAE